MGSHNFTWSHPANEVYVTGTFDNWSKSTRLDNHNGVFSKTVNLPSATDNVYYKFVVDGNWVTDHTAAGEHDYSGNWNNVLKAHNITPHAPKQTSSPTTSSSDNRPAPRGAESYMATKHMPGAFPPETPMTEAPGFSMTPLPASSSRESRSDEQEERSFGVSPLPASSGASNPISLRPGEPVPSTDSYTSHSIGSNVHHDREAYERSDALPSGPPFPGSSGSSTSGAFQLPAVGRSMIPESSLPMGSGADVERDAGPFMRSAGAGTSTADLAAQVPREPRGVPEVVRESQHQAHADPEASGSPEAVFEKREVEQELKRQISPQPASSEGTAGRSGVTSGRYGGSTAPHDDDEDYGSSTGTSTAVPGVVTESQHRAHVSPEASASTDAVSHKQAMERELQREVSREPAISDSTTGGYSGGSSSSTNQTPHHTTSTAIPEVVSESQHQAHVDPEASAFPNAVAQKQQMERELNREVSEEPATKESSSSNYNTSSGSQAAVPDIVTESQQRAHVSPEASASTGAVANKQDVEDELLDKVPEQPAAAQSGTLTSTNVSHQATHAGEIVSHAGEIALAGGAALLGSAIAGVAAISHNLPASVQNASHGLPSSISSFISSMNTGHGGSLFSHGQQQASAPPTQQVPATVNESIARSGESPEATTNPEAVSEKATMEKELLAEVSPTNETGEHAPTFSQASTGNAIFGSTARRAGQDSHPHVLPPSSSGAVPEVVSESYDQAHQDREAAAFPNVVAEKSIFEKELLSEVPRATEAGEPAPSNTAALSATAPSSSHAHASENYAQSGSSRGYAGGSVGENVASYIPGTQANASSRAAEGSSEYPGGSTGETIASYIPGTHANAVAKEGSSNPDYIGGSTGKTIASYIPGTEANREAQGNSNHPGGSTGETVASYIPGTQAHAASRSSSNYDTPPSNTSGGHHIGRDAAALLGVGATAGGAEYAYNEHELAHPVDTTAPTSGTTSNSRDVDHSREQPSAQTGAAASGLSGAFATDPVTAPGGARTVPTGHYAVPLHTVDAFRDDPVSASASQSQSTSAHTGAAASGLSGAFATDPVTAPGGARGAPAGHYAVPLHTVDAFRDDPVSASASQSQSNSAHTGAAASGLSGAFATDPVTAPGGARTVPADRYAVPLHTVAAFRDDPVSASQTSGNATQHSGQSTHDQSQGYIGGAAGQAIASFIPGTQANAASKQTSGSSNYVGGSTGQTIASYIPGTQANATSREATGSPDYVGGSTGEKIASYIPGTDAFAASREISRGGDYAEDSSSDSQGYAGGSTGQTLASYIPGTQANAASRGTSGHAGYLGGSTGENIASYIPGTDANAASKTRSSSPRYSTSAQGSRSPDYVGGSTGETIASYIPGTEANAASKAHSGSAGYTSTQDSYAQGSAPYSQSSTSYEQGSRSYVPGSSSYGEDTYASTSSASNVYASTSQPATMSSSGFIASLPQGVPSSSFIASLPQGNSILSDLQTSYPSSAQPVSSGSRSGLHAAEIGGASVVTAAAVAGVHSLMETAPAHTTTYTSQEGPVGQAFTSPEYEVPSTTSEYGVPSTSSRYEAPLASSGYEAPLASSGYEAPPTSSRYEAPPTPSGYEAPPTSSGYEAPSTSSGYEAPTSSVREAPATTSARDAPLSSVPAALSSVPAALSSGLSGQGASHYEVPSASARDMSLSSGPSAAVSSGLGGQVAPGYDMPAESVQEVIKPSATPVAPLSAAREASVPSEQSAPTSVPREGGALSSARAAMASVRKSTSSARKPSASGPVGRAASSARPMSMAPVSSAPFTSASANPASSGLNATTASGLNASTPVGAAETGSLAAPAASVQPASTITTASGKAPAAVAAGSAMKEALGSKPRNDSRDVSPFSKSAAAAGGAGSAATTGVATGSTPARTAGWQGASSASPSTPQRMAGQTTSISGSPAAGSQEDKKKKRRSFFGKIKDKLRG